MLKYNFPHLRSGIFCRMCCYFGKDPFHSAAVCFYVSNVFVSCFAACTEPSIHPPPVVPPVVVPKTYEPWRMEWSTPEPTDGRTKGNSIVNYHRRLQGMACEMGMRNGGEGLISQRSPHCCSKSSLQSGLAWDSAKHRKTSLSLPDPSQTQRLFAPQNAGD